MPYKALILFTDLRSCMVLRCESIFADTRMEKRVVDDKRRGPWRPDIVRQMFSGVGGRRDLNIPCTGRIRFRFLCVHKTISSSTNESCIIDLSVQNQQRLRLFQGIYCRSVRYSFSDSGDKSATLTYCVLNRAIKQTKMTFDEALIPIALLSVPPFPPLVDALDILSRFSYFDLYLGIVMKWPPPI